ncbi:hypothetical protein [Actinoplanes couchii]|uniref:Uncharacterized protein n=1 Tax=Actinoplanes couchii TaxID=403638 RepID=A0ABQ3XFE3_9ACTN|nr:hypothetical protein [Actinoplanes couchii]MDR6321830.1 hypothetical protein [Actinoplanes couchii]GID57214.1 hypothetical protein Aco03nite_056180 [Actinoplanes couchii]
MNLVRGIAASAVLTVFAVTLGACGPIGVLQSRAVEAGAGSVSALDGLVRFSAPEGATEGTPRVSFRREPLPSNRPFPPAMATVGDMVSIDVEGGNISRGRITLDYGTLPAAVDPEMLNLFGWSSDLGGWIPLTGTLTDAVDRSVSGDTVLFDSFVVGTWRVSSDDTGDSITTGAGTVLPVAEGTSPTFWAYARSAAVSALNESVNHLTGTTLVTTPVPGAAGSTTPSASATGRTSAVASTAPTTPAPTPSVSTSVVATKPEALVCTPQVTGVTVGVTSVPAGRFDACLVTAGTGTQQLRVRNRYPFPMVLDLPTDGRVQPVPDSETGVDGIRDTVLTYLKNQIAVGGGETVTLNVRPGSTTGLRLTGRLDWSVIALDAGLRQLDLLLPNSRAMRPITAEALLQAHAEFGPAAVTALAAGDTGNQAVRSLLQKAGLTGADRSVADLFQFSACVLERTDYVAGSDADVLAALKHTGPTIVVYTSDCLRTIYDKYLPPGARSVNQIVDTLKATTRQVRAAVPGKDRKQGFGQVVITVGAR